jgi:radical SAM superfamily enzyme YgiQ (UPF0313 family)
LEGLIKGNWIPVIDAVRPVEMIGSAATLHWPDDSSRFWKMTTTGRSMPMKTTSRRQELARLERFTEEPNRFGAYRIALGFPNSYEIGMSNLGFQWVYRLFNRIPDLVCERFFSEEGEPAVTFESGTPLSDFGLLAWSLSWEMDVVNIVRTLSAAGIPLRREARDERHPLLLVGGDIARMNPAVLAPFVDVFALGDGERLVPAIADLAKRGRIRHLPVQQGDQLVGIISIGDVLKHRLDELELEANVMRDYAVAARR